MTCDGDWLWACTVYNTPAVCPTCGPVVIVPIIPFPNVNMIKHKIEQAQTQDQVIHESKKTYQSQAILSTSWKLGHLPCHWEDRPWNKNSRVNSVSRAHNLHKLRSVLPPVHFRDGEGERGREGEGWKNREKTRPHPPTPVDPAINIIQYPCLPKLEGTRPHTWMQPARMFWLVW